MDRGRKAQVLETEALIVGDLVFPAGEGHRQTVFPPGLLDQGVQQQPAIAPALEVRVDRQAEYGLVGVFPAVAAHVGKHLIFNGGLADGRAHAEAYHLALPLPQQHMAGIGGDPRLHGLETGGLFRREAGGLDGGAALCVLRSGGPDHQGHCLVGKLLQKFTALPDFRAHVGHVPEVGCLDLLGVGGAAAGNKTGAGRDRGPGAPNA